MASRPRFETVDVDGGSLGVLHWPGDEDAAAVIGVPGITANAWDLDPIAHHLAGRADFFAVDLRGRGRSFETPGPFGLRVHAADIVEIGRQIGRSAILLGHSVGAHVALLAAQQAPELFPSLVLVDGGPPIAGVASDEVEATLERVFGTAITRLRTVWPDRVSYHTMWSQHPAFAEGLSIDLERNLLADLVEVDGGFRICVDEAAVLADARDLLTDPEMSAQLMNRSIPTTVLRATAGVMGEPPPAISERTMESMPWHRWITVPDTNHYTILMGAAGARAIVDAVLDEIEHRWTDPVRAPEGQP